MTAQEITNYKKTIKQLKDMGTPKTVLDDMQYNLDAEINGWKYDPSTDCIEYREYKEIKHD